MIRPILINYTLDTLADTRHLANDLVERTESGGLIILNGPLGAGKTTLTQQIGLVLGSKAAISSPTYTLIHEYPTPEGTLVHIDAYRLHSSEALFELGLDDYLERARLVVVEWGEDLLKHFPYALKVNLSFEQGTRTATLSQSPTPTS